MSVASFELGFLGTSTGAQPYVRRGVGHPIQVLVVQPLFEERNRLRRLLAETTRRLAAVGVGSWMFDLPCTGDSAGATIDAVWTGWIDSVEKQAQHITSTGCDELHIFSARGGGLLDQPAACSHYRLAPVAGERLLRELMRSRAAARGGVTIASLESRFAQGEAIELGGFEMSAALAASLRAAGPQPVAPLRTAVVGDASGDVTLSGPPLWRQAEPAEEPVLADALAADLLEWIGSCGAR